jgi:hypothetical protein
MMAYTTQQYIAELERRKKSFDKARIIAGCALAAHDSQIMRMWDKGLNGNNQKLVSQYSTKPIYINAFQSPRGIKPVGKTGQTTFKTSGKPHKTQYFAGGYDQFKKSLQRPMFEIFGRLKKNFTNSLQKRGDSYVTGVSGDDNVSKYQNLIKKYGKVSFMLTKDEKTKYSNCINAKLNNILRGQNV